MNLNANINRLLTTINFLLPIFLLCFIILFLVLIGLLITILAFQLRSKLNKQRSKNNRELIKRNYISNESPTTIITTPLTATIGEKLFPIKNHLIKTTKKSDNLQFNSS